MLYHTDNRDLYHVSESYWFETLTLAQRAHYEMCIHAIVYTHFQGNRATVLDFVYSARARGLHTNSLVAAVLWRLQEEVDND